MEVDQHVRFGSDFSPDIFPRCRKNARRQR